jgi:two-component system phosphate regulon sensor histidine kinase PhoR
VVSMPDLSLWKPFLRLLLIQLGSLAVLLPLLGVPLGQSALIVGIFAGLSALMGHLLLRPLVRLITSAIRRDRKIADDLGTFVAQEWGEFEAALDELQRDLSHKTAALSQERSELSTLMSAISDAVLAVDSSGRPLFFNSRFAMLFGGGRIRENQLGLEEMFRSPEVSSAFREAVRVRQTQTLTASLYVRGSQAPRSYALSVSPLLKTTEQAYGALGIFHDITELKQAERMRIDFVANVSHELRTPMTAIKGFADTLKEDIAQGRTDSLNQCVDAISRNVTRLMEMVRDLLDLSSIENESEKESESVKSSVATRELTERVFTALEKTRAQRRHELTASYDAATVPAHPGRLEQVVTNLVENALKYVPPGGKIQVHWEDRPDHVLLHVSDNGPGIPAEEQPRLFERFYRIDRARSRDIEGTGLGLAIVKHIMQRHGGWVMVASEPGKGATFTCRFPKGE